MEILKGFKIVFRKQFSIFRAWSLWLWQIQQCQNCFVQTQIKQKDELESYYESYYSFFQQVTNSFVWIPSEKPVRCLWDHCHSFEAQCEPSPHHTQSHASDPPLQSLYLRKANLAWAAPARRVTVCIAIHWGSGMQIFLTPFLLKQLPVMVTISHWNPSALRRKARQGLSIPAPSSGFVHAAVSPCLLSVPCRLSVTQTQRWGWQSDTAQLC